MFFRQFFFDEIDGNINNIEIAALVAVSRNFYLLLATWRPPALVARLRYDQVVGQGTFSRTNW